MSRIEFDALSASLPLESPYPAISTGRKGSPDTEITACGTYGEIYPHSPGVYRAIVWKPKAYEKLTGKTMSFGDEALVTLAESEVPRAIKVLKVPKNRSAQLRRLKAHYGA